MLLYLVPVVRALRQLLLQHENDLVLVLLVHPLHVQLAADHLLLLYDPALQPDRVLQLHQTLAEQHLDTGFSQNALEVHHLLPGEGLALLATGSGILEEAHEAFENAAVENSAGLSPRVAFVLLVGCVLVIIVVLPLHKYLIGDQGLILFIWDLEVPQETQILDG